MRYNRIISYGRGTLPQLIECFDSSNDECMEFSRQQLHINITLLDVLIFSMDFFIRNDIEAKKLRRISRKKTDSGSRKNAASEDSFYVTARSMVW